MLDSLFIMDPVQQRILVFIITVLSFSLAQADSSLILKIKKEGLKITKFAEGLYHLQLKNKKPKNGTEYLIVRVVNAEEFDLLGQGTIQGSQNRVSYLKLNQEKMYKKPLKGDYVIPLASGLEFEEVGGDVDDGELGTEKVTNDESGYLQLAYSSLFGSYDTESSTLANSSKVVDYNFTSIHFKWYLEFAWRFGIELNQYSGVVPTRDYERILFDSERSHTSINFLYRLRKWKKTRFRNVLFATMIDDSFETVNDDEYLLTTNYKLFGLGATLNYEMSNNLWSKKGIGIKINRLYISATYFPVVTATDVGVSRGTDSSSNLSYSYSAGADILFYWDKIPYIKRWFLSASYESTVYDMKFSGPTVSEDDPFYIIPPGGTAKESYSNYKIMFGVRLQDYIGSFFKPR